MGVLVEGLSTSVFGVGAIVARFSLMTREETSRAFILSGNAAARSARTIRINSSFDVSTNSCAPLMTAVRYESDFPVSLKIRLRLNTHCVHLYFNSKYRSEYISRV